MKNQLKHLIEIIPGRLYLSNSEVIHGGTVWRVRGRDLYTGVVFHHEDGGELYCKPAVLSTPRLVSRELATSPETLLQAFESGLFDIFDIHLLKTYADGKSLEKMQERLSKQVKASQREQRIAQMLQELNEKFPNLSPELRERVKNHDFFYDYSDDINVWRNGMERSAKLQKDLEAVGCLEYMKAYATIVHTGH